MFGFRKKSYQGEDNGRILWGKKRTEMHLRTDYSHEDSKGFIISEKKTKISVWHWKLKRFKSTTYFFPFECGKRFLKMTIKPFVYKTPFSNWWKYFQTKSKLKKYKGFFFHHRPSINKEGSHRNDVCWRNSHQKIVSILFVHSDVNAILNNSIRNIMSFVISSTVDALHRNWVNSGSRAGTSVMQDHIRPD